MNIVIVKGIFLVIAPIFSNLNRSMSYYYFILRDL